MLTRLEIIAGEESYDRIAGLLTVLVSAGWEEESLMTGETLFRIHCENAALIQDLRLAVESREPEAKCSVEKVEEQDWVNSWKEFFTPVPCGKNFVVLPPWHRQESGFEGRKKICIEPKSAFGTGHHATTALCLSVLSDLLDEGRIVAGQRFLDLGTGSGVLGIGLCETGLVGEGYDIDPIAVDNALENRVLNGIPEADFVLGLGSIEKVEERKFDLVVANILARPLIELAPALVATMKEGAVLVLSGLLCIQADSVENAYRSQGLPVARRIVNGEWCALVWS